MPSALTAPSHRATDPRRARRLAGSLLIAALAAILLVPAGALAGGGGGGGGTGGSGGHHGTGTGAATLERFALSLVNCVRTGGWVTAKGTCRGYGSGRYSAYVKPIPYSAAIARRVARPYAKRLARADACEHTLAGTDIDQRFHAGGFRGPINGESIGCSNGYTLRQMIVHTHRMMQSEKSFNGWHWKNMKDKDWKRVGIGIAQVGSETRVVYDFYGS